MTIIPNRRHTPVVDLVCDVLENATEPLTAETIRARIVCEAGRTISLNDVQRTIERLVRTELADVFENRRTEELLYTSLSKHAKHPDAIADDGGPTDADQGKTRAPIPTIKAVSWDGTTQFFARRGEANEWVASHLADWMNPDDKICWYNLNAEHGIATAYVCDVAGEPTDAGVRLYKHAQRDMPEYAD